jgi:hypothetical protein
LHRRLGGPQSQSGLVIEIFVVRFEVFIRCDNMQVQEITSVSEEPATPIVSPESEGIRFLQNVGSQH